MPDRGPEQIRAEIRAERDQLDVALHQLSDEAKRAAMVTGVALAAVAVTFVAYRLTFGRRRRRRAAS